MNISQILKQIPEEEKTPSVISLMEAVQYLLEENQQLKDEIARLQKRKGKPKVKPSRLEKRKKQEDKPKGKRPGSEKKAKTKSLEIHETQEIEPEGCPAGSRIRGYDEYVVQGLKFQAHNIRYRLVRRETPDGEILCGELPAGVRGNHFSPELRAFIIFQHYHAMVTQPLIREQLLEVGVDISAGQINRILIEGKEDFHREKEEILRVGLEVSPYVNVDDTGARHKGKNGYCTHIGNLFFAHFESTESKSRINFLQILRAGGKDYVINPDAIAYMQDARLPRTLMDQMSQRFGHCFEDESAWKRALAEMGITNARHIRIATEGALIGSVMSHGCNPKIVIVSDDAGQFNIWHHALCWIHAERTIAALIGFSDHHKEILEAKRSQIWDYYDELKAYKRNPTKREKKRLRKLFDEIFAPGTGFASLDMALKRLHANKDELLLVLERPEIPLHNNLSETDIREFVKKRKISGSTRSSPGRKCRDTFASLKKTCRKLGVSFWDFLNDRLTTPCETVPWLPELIRIRAAECQPA